MVIGYDVFQNLTDTRTLIPLVKKMNDEGTFVSVIVADVDFGTEANYRFFEDEVQDATAFILYNTMHREASRKWHNYSHRTEAKDKKSRFSSSIYESWKRSPNQYWSLMGISESTYARKPLWQNQLFNLRTSKIENVPFSAVIVLSQPQKNVKDSNQGAFLLYWNWQI